MTAAQTMTDCGFWGLVTIFPFVDDEEAQTRSFCWFIIYWMSNFYSSVNTKFGSVRWPFPGEFPCMFGHSWPHDCPSAPGDAASRRPSPDRPSTPGAWWICSHQLRWPRFCSFCEGFIAAFPSYFSGVEGSRHSVVFRTLVGQGRFWFPGNSSQSSTPLNDSYKAVLQLQHSPFHFCEA